MEEPKPLALTATLAEYMDRIWDVTVQTFDRCGQVSPKIVALDPAGLANVMLLDDTTDGCLLMAHIVMKRLHALKYAFVGEIWCAVVDKTEDLSSPDWKPPSERDDRYESVIIVAGDLVTGEMLQGVCTIKVENGIKSLDLGTYKPSAPIPGYISRFQQILSGIPNTAQTVQ